MVVRLCDQCGGSYEAQRSSSRFCSSGCRSRRAQGVPPVSVGAKPVKGALSAATEAELVLVGRLDTVLGRSALELARRVESPAESGASVASLNREFRATLEAALEGVKKAADPLDELEKRRLAKLNAG